jgi:ResB-like family
VVPENCRPGLEKNELVPALRCALIRDGKSSEDFFIRLGTLLPEMVQVGGEWFFVQYGMATRQMNFSLTLKQAQQRNDPGTDRAASFSSDVVLTYERKKGEKVTEDHHIWMNNPLEYGPYKVYQTNYERITLDPDTGKLISKSALTVANDPGLWYKYAGSLIVVLGICVMFYMKAYFFKPSGRRVAEINPAPEVS